MEDRVGEVLAQRRALESGAAAGVALSVFLHTAGAAIVVYAALHQAPPQTVNTLTINLEPLTNVAPPPPAARRVTTTLREPQPVIEQPKPAAKPEPKTVPLSPFGKSAKKGSETPVAPPPVRAAEGGGATSTAAASNVAIGGVGAAAIEGDFPFPFYVRQVNKLIGDHWSRPEVKPGTTVAVRIVIDRDGTVHDATIVTSSGNPLYDRSALRAVLETSPLPPLPFAFNGTYLGVKIIFQ